MTGLEIAGAVVVLIVAIICLISTAKDIYGS